MRCLWLTLADPEPRHNGQYLYSGGLIDAVAGAGATVDVLALARPDSARQDGARNGSIGWWLAEHRPRPNWASLSSIYPHIVDRCRTGAIRHILSELLDLHPWDCIVFDGISMAWAIQPVLRRFHEPSERPKLVYVSHNHEESLRPQIAKSQRHGLKRWAARLDAFKVARLERRLVDAVDLVTAITPEDRELYRARHPSKAIAVLTPGYSGRLVEDRRITEDLPRRAVILGSFGWIAKRMNLEEFVTVADPIFAAAGAELQVIGSAEPAFLDHFRGSVSATRFTGTVDSVTSFLDRARIAVVPERNGGGFKLKVLDYVFNRMPVLALCGSVAGMPLHEPEDILLFDDHRALAKGVLRAMDDLDLLNRMQEAAYSACRDKFDWASRGRHLLSAIAAL